MDWSALLEDLESSFDAQRRADVAAAGADLAEAEIGAVTLMERLVGAIGCGVQLRTRGGAVVDGRLRMASGQVVVIDEGEGLQAVIAVDRLALVSPLGGAAPRPPGAGATMPSVLRALGRQRARVRLVLACGEVVGRIGRVGRDHVDVVADSAPIGRAGPARLAVALSAIEVVRSR